MPFTKGHRSWNTGKKMSKKFRKRQSNYMKKHPLRYWLGKERPKRDKSCHWKGGKIMAQGYVLILRHDHPFCNNHGYVLEHRLVMEKHIRRYLLPKEVVHHINGNPSDNRIENLMLFENGRYHFWFHKKGFCNNIGIIFKP